MLDQRASIGNGFQVEKPDVFLAWGTPIPQLLERLAGHVVEQAAGGLLMANCEVLNGLQCRMWIHPEPPYYAAEGTAMTRLSFWCPGDVEASFRTIQKHLEMTFGGPTETIPGADGCPGEYKWLLDGVIIGHYVNEKGGLQEVAMIRKM
jgi:hypothetical protein